MNNIKDIVKSKNFQIISIIIILSFLLRVLTIDLQSIWRDESFSINAAKESFSTLMQISSKDTQPPLHLILLHFWIKLFGDSTISVRLLSMIFGLLLFIPAYKISKPSKDSNLFRSKHIQYLFLIFIAINPILIAYSIEARAYSMLQFFFLFSYYFYQIINKFDFEKEIVPKKDLYGFTFFTVLALYTHNVFLLVVCGYVCIFLFSFIGKYYNKIGKEELVDIVKYTILFFAPTGILYLPWFATFLNQYTKVSNEGFWLKLHPFSDPPNEFIRAFIGEQIPQHSIFVYLLIALIIGTVTAIFFYGAKVVGLKSKSHLQNLIIIFAVIYVFSFSTSFVFIRYISFLVPLLLIILSIGFYRLLTVDKKSFQILLSIFVGATLILFLGFFTTYQGKFRYKEVLSNIEYNNETDLILNLDAMSFHSTKYYLNLENKIYDPKREIALFEGTAVLKEDDYFDGNLSDYERLWVVALYGKSREDVLLQNGFRFKEEFRDRELRVQLYQR